LTFSLGFWVANHKKFQLTHPLDFWGATHNCWSTRSSK
jgi:hypothetical protein